MVKEKKKSFSEGWICPRCDVVVKPSHSICDNCKYKDKAGPEKPLTIQKVRETVCDYFNLPYDCLDHKTREREVVQARQIATFFCCEFSLEERKTIGVQVGKKSNGNVYYSLRTIKNLIQTDRNIRTHVIKIRDILKTLCEPTHLK
jgi:chromosomal replication initiation ATPase DnaA